MYVPGGSVMCESAEMQGPSVTVMASILPRSPGSTTSATRHVVLSRWLTKFPNAGVLAGCAMVLANRRAPLRVVEREAGETVAE
jgi:hypothetical protein